MQMSFLAYNTARRSLFYFVKYRIHLSLIFCFLLYYNNLYYGGLNYFLIASFSLWHFALFLFDRIYDRKLDQVSQPDEYVPETQAKALYSVVMACMVASFALFVATGYPFYYWLPLLPITFLYTVPVVNGKRAKNIFLVKNLYSAALIYALPLMLQGVLLNGGNYEGLNYPPVVSLFIYVLIGEIFWDIRDMTVDKENNIATLPNTVGLLATKLIMAGLILTDEVKSGFSISQSAIIYLLLLPFVTEKTDRLIFHLPPLIALLRFCL